MLDNLEFVPVEIITIHLVNVEPIMRSCLWCWLCIELENMVVNVEMMHKIEL